MDVLEATMNDCLNLGLIVYLLVIHLIQTKYIVAKSHE